MNRSKPDIYKIVGANIKAIREAKVISISDLARQCGMQADNFKELEAGNAELRLSTFVHIKNLLGVSYEQLFHLPDEYER
ncbi:helix-turn-helix domain-containing protein [Chitinophaga sp. NPDC101104]|uniref:helix-turn-helix domain-containing protein n=1 Tax=Chitinophaga sp. NPDC101104 TaxID=3390561 RepID=UPI003D04E3AD